MAANITTFQNGVVAGDKIGEQWLNECYDEVKDTSTGHDHDGSDSKKVDYDNLTNPPIIILDSGSTTHVASTTGFENITSFAIPDDLGDDEIVIDFFGRNASDSGFRVTIGATSTPTGNDYTSTTALYSSINLRMMKDPNSNNEIGIANANSNSTVVLNQSLFTLNAAETVYLGGLVNSGVSYYVRWMAYRVKA